MAYFDFSGLIEKYSVSFTVLCSGEGHYNDLGDWVTDEPEEQEKTGAIIGISESKLYRSDGVLTEKDKQLYMLESLGKIDKAHVIYAGNKYKVEQEPTEGNAQFTGCYSYVLKWVSAFDRKEAGT